MTQLAAELPAGEDGRPRDPLAVLERAMLHPNCQPPGHHLGSRQVGQLQICEKRDLTSGGLSLCPPDAEERLAHGVMLVAEDKKRREQEAEKLAMQPAPISTNSPETGRIRVRLKSNDKIGTVLASDFNPEKYERLDDRQF